MTNVTSSTPSSGLKRYVAVLRRPGVGRPAVGTALASLPIGMLGLAVLLLVRQSGSGFADAGIVVGLLGVGTGVGMAAQGRLIDRLGQPRVLLPAASVELVAVAFLVMAVDGGAPTWLTGGLALVTGLSEPQVGGSLRGLWPGLVPAELRDTANALSSVLFAGPVLLGPLVVAVLVAMGGPAVAVLAGGGCCAAGTWLLARSRSARSWRPEAAPGRGLFGALRSPGVRTVTVISAGQGMVTAFLQIPAAAAAAVTGAPGRAPLLYAALSAGSLLGTVGYGAHRWTLSLVRQLIVLLGMVAAAGVVCAATATSLPLLAGGLFVVGLALGPTGVCCYALVEALPGRGTGVEAFTTITAAGVGAFAAGTAAAGFVVERTGPATAFLVAAVVACAAGAALGVRPRSVSAGSTTA